MGKKNRIKGNNERNKNNTTVPKNNTGENAEKFKAYHLDNILPKLQEVKQASISFTSLTVFFCYLTYMLIFHSLSNMPIKSLFYGVVARFWMQPNIIVYVWVGLGLAYI